MRTLRRLFHAPLLPVYLLAQSKAQSREVIGRDVVKAIRLSGGSVSDQPGLIDVLDVLARREFRSVFYTRLRIAGGALGALAIVLLRIYTGQVALEISCDDIGPGLVILHGFATIVVAQSVGRDCMIAQQVTIGFKDGRQPPPIIGDRVCVMAGAMVLGDIEVGHDAVVGAGSLVVSDVPAYAIMGGVPARVLRYKDAPQADDEEPMKSPLVASS
jgi:serine acetyltransferase